MNLYLALLMITTTIHVSKTYPRTHDYGLATCSAVFVGPNELLTARHCLRNNRNHQWVKIDDNLSLPMTIEAISEETDLALLIIPELKNHPYTKLGKPVGITEKIYTVNSGDEIEHTYNTGIVCNIAKVFDDEPAMVMHNAAIVGGASGSGLFNKKGQLVGINTRGNGPLSLAVGIEDIKKFIDETHKANEAHSH